MNSEETRIHGRLTSADRCCAEKDDAHESGLFSRVVAALFDRIRR